MQQKRSLSGFLRRRFITAFVNSTRGLLAAWRCDESVKIELALLPVLIVVALVAGPGKIEKILLTTSAFLVLIVEFLNTGIEKTIDRISTKPHKLSKFVKDVSSAAVFIAVLNCLMVWGLVFL